MTWIGLKSSVALEYSSSVEGAMSVRDMGHERTWISVLTSQ